MLKVCEYCGKTFETKQGQSKYCSHEHRIAAQKERAHENWLSKKNHANQDFVKFAGVKFPKEADSLNTVPISVQKKENAKE